MRRLALLLFAILVAGDASATTDVRGRESPVSDRQTAPLDGHWEAQITGDSKLFTIAFDFVVKRNVLTGMVTLLSNDREEKIRDGKFDGTNVAFTALGKFTGKLVGKELRLTRELDYGKKQELVAHRTAAPKSQ